MMRYGLLIAASLGVPAILAVGTSAQQADATGANGKLTTVLADLAKTVTPETGAVSSPRAAVSSTLAIGMLRATSVRDARAGGCGSMRTTRCRSTS